MQPLAASYGLPLVRGSAHTPDGFLEQRRARRRGFASSKCRSSTAASKASRFAERKGRCMTGAGTVRAIADVARVRDAGGNLIVMPHADGAVVREARRLGMTCLPGVATPTEAFAALDAGADGLKMFPAESLPPPVLKAWRAVLPADALVFPVGGIKPDNMAGYWAAGASGFGTGSNLYRPGVALDDVRAAARPTRRHCAHTFAMMRPARRRPSRWAPRC